MEITSLTSQELGTTVQEASLKTEVSEQERMSARNADIAKIQQNVNYQKRENYTVVSKDGDTLELSDMALAKYSKSKLKQLLQNGKISRQQYEKAIKRK